jgi:CheY-like chemotaxis protein
VADTTDVSSMPIEILLADDHAMVRSGLRVLLDAEEDFRVVAEAGDVEAALRLAEARQPQIVVLDLKMPGTPSMSAIPRFLEASPGVAVIVLTMHDDPGYAREALTAGASGYVLKDAAHDELVGAVRAAVAGRTYLDPSLGARLAAAPADSVPAGAELDVAVGSTFAGHRIDAVAGRGGMAVVFEATDLALDRRVALKIIQPAVALDPVFRARFERESRMAAAIDHPRVVPVFHAGTDRGLLYITMRYVAGTDLRRLLVDEGRLEPGRAAGIVAQVAEALDEAHGEGLVHRDVKPGNILIASRAGADQAYLADFGVTKQQSVGPGLTGTGLAIGTADYMAPEQAMGQDVDARADVYALGCVLFEALTGAVVYDRGSDLDKMWAHAHEPPPALLEVRPDLPAALEDVVGRALSKRPADRQQSAGELAREALEAIG